MRNHPCPVPACRVHSKSVAGVSSHVRQAHGRWARPPCRDCLRPRAIHAKGLCQGCYNRLKWATQSSTKPISRALARTSANLGMPSNAS